jgi:hypothetical protein
VHNPTGNPKAGRQHAPDPVPNTPIPVQATYHATIARLPTARRPTVRDRCTSVITEIAVAMQEFLCCLIQTQVCPDRVCVHRAKIHFANLLPDCISAFQSACIMGRPCSKCCCRAPTAGRYYQHGVREMSEKSSGTQWLQQRSIQLHKSAKGEVQLQHPLTTKHALQNK